MSKCLENRNDECLNLILMMKCCRGKFMQVVTSQVNGEVRIIFIACDETDRKRELLFPSLDAKSAMFDDCVQSPLLHVLRFVFCWT